MDWDKLRVFHVVSEAGSFTHAGEQLNLGQSAVSRQISSLEESLKVTLFHRHARGLILTEQGEMLYRTAREIYASVNMAQSRLVESQEKPEGQLKITTTVAFGSVWLTSRIKGFIEMYPEIQVSVVLADNELDLSMREADVAIRMMPPRKPDLIQRHLMTMRYRIYASPAYLEANGTPETPEELENHKMITYGDGEQFPVDRYNWLMEGRTPILKVNSTYGIYRAVQSGLGIAALPDYMSYEDVNLVEVLPDLEGPSFDSYFVYPEELRHNKRIGVFRDFLVRSISEAGLQ
jgi:DNA-binding transcriptional LysR family regulator